MKKSTLFCLFTLGLTTPTAAHEGHGTPGHGHTVQHYLLEPAHIPVVVLVVATMIVSAIFLARAVSRRRAAHHHQAPQTRV